MTIQLWSRFDTFKESAESTTHWFPSDARFKVCETRPHLYTDERWIAEGGPDGKLGWVTYAEGMVLTKYEENGYHDSDFIAVWWNGKKVINVTYATTRGWSYLNGATVDASDEVRADAEEWQVKKRIPSIKSRNWKQAHDIDKGDKVVVWAFCFECIDPFANLFAEVSRPYTSGEEFFHTDKLKSDSEDCPQCGADLSRLGTKKAPPLGTVGTVFWRGKCQYSGSQRVGVEVEMGGDRFFLDIGREETHLCVSKADWPDELWSREEVERIAKVSGGGRLW